MQSSTLPRKEYYTNLMTQELIQSLSLIFRINKPFLAHRQIKIPAGRRILTSSAGISGFYKIEIKNSIMHYGNLQTRYAATTKRPFSAW